MKFSLCSLMVIVAVSLSKGDDFDYRYQAKWYDIVGAECSLDRQSPIELSSTEAVVLNNIPPIVFNNYDISYIQSAVISNNGKSANIEFPKRIFSPSITGGPLQSKRYIAEGIHFHWGSQDSHGSEHVIDSQRFSLEMHIVHRNSDYATVDEATQHEDGLAVLGVLFQVEPSLQNGFAGLISTINSLKHIEKFDQSRTIANINLSDLFDGISTNDFFTYQGSLTTPPCSQAVTWIVFSQPISISQKQMSSFRSLLDNHDEVLENNYRHLQAKGTRPVYLCQI